jgi:hypothetical protein
MRRFVFPLMLAAATADPVSAQADAVFVVGTRHSPWAVGLLELAVPTAGFAYAGDWTRGFPPNAFRLASLIGLYVAADGSFEGYQYHGCRNETACNLWTVAVLGTTVWAVVGAVQTARDHNRSPSPQAPPRLLVEPSPPGGLSLGLRFRSP